MTLARLAALDAAIGRAVVRARRSAHARTAAPSSVIALQLIDAATADAIPLQPRAGERPLFTGDGALNYVCPVCRRVLCRGIAPGDLAGLVLRCACRATTRVPGELEAPGAAHA